MELDDPYGTLAKQRSTEIGEGRITPTASTGKFIVGLINNLMRSVKDDLVFYREFLFSLMKEEQQQFLCEFFKQSDSLLSLACQCQRE